MGVCPAILLVANNNAAIADKGFYMMVCTVYIFLGLAFTSTIIEIVRRQMVENLRKMQELRAQIQAQVKLAETLKKLSDNAGKLCVFLIQKVDL